MEYEKYFDARNSEVEFHVFSSAHPTADMESEAFSASYLEKYKILSYLNKGACAVGKRRCEK